MTDHKLLPRDADLVPVFDLQRSDEIAAVTPPAADVALVASVAEERLRALVEELAVPRSFFAEPRANRRVARRLVELFAAAGLEAREEGLHANVVARPRGAPRAAPPIVLGAHYDSVPGCPGADDDASGLAALVAAGELLARREPPPAVLLVAWNAEEEGMLGSRETAAALARAAPTPRVAHVLEMVGYRDATPGAQATPPGLPFALPERGDFLGLVADPAATTAARRVAATAAAVSGPPVLALTVDHRSARAHPVLRRSDHASFWDHRLPAVMWTDTAEFRNPHYHRPTDTPDTLDYPFLTAVTRLLLLAALA